jgi:4'-phosphopantetheinyl transferase EntD
VLERLLPPGVHCAESFGDVPEDLRGLFPAEAALVARAVVGRRAEFATARGCARRALAALGVPPAPLLPGTRGAPVWPEGTVGSITHCSGYRASAVARHDTAASVGIDAEPDAPLPRGMLEVVAGPAERSALAALTREAPSLPWGRLLFSAKESVYKAWFPLTGRPVDFADAEVLLRTDPGARSTGAFTARMLVPGPPGATLFHGRWAAATGLLLTAIVVPPLPPGQVRDIPSPAPSAAPPLPPRP